MIQGLVDQNAKIIPAASARAELTVERSRFIASAGYAGDVDQARAFIQSIRSEFPGATHNVPLFIIGHGAGTTMHCSDDGEPAGTAGRPALAVLQGSGLGDVVVVITRYFGGIKLGTGGLVRAYSDAVREVLAALPLAEKAATTQLLVEIPYTLLERLRLLAGELSGKIEEEDFTDQVTMTLRFRDEAVNTFFTRLKDMCQGSEKVVIMEQSVITALPVFNDPGANSGGRAST